jgi:hypothetical protein
MMERAFDALGNHERKTIELITGIGSGKKSSLPKVLSNHNLDSKGVADIIEKTAEHRLLVDIVSSQLDADLMPNGQMVGRFSSGARKVASADHPIPRNCHRGRWSVEPAAESEPIGAVEAGYVPGRHPADFIEATAHVYALI